MRQGFVLPVMLLSVGAAGMLVLVIIGSAASRAREARTHQARVQGREWCLGARVLPTAGTIAVGAWRITVDDTHAASASGPLGTNRIAADGHESWSHTP